MICKNRRKITAFFGNTQINERFFSKKSTFWPFFINIRRNE